MHTIIEEENIDAVIDSGDIVNFGRVQEGDAAGIPPGSSRSACPTSSSSGNHDPPSAERPAVLDRLARIPNVVLLEPDATDLHEVTINGMRIAGFNDPRCFGDDNTDTTARGRSLRPRYNAAVAGAATGPTSS